MRKASIGRLILEVILTAALLFSGNTRADLIDFELTADGVTPSDNHVLNKAYQITINGAPTGDTVRFFFDTNGDNTYDKDIDEEPVFERRGTGSNPGTSAFISQWLGNDSYDWPRTPAFEQRMGDFFLRKSQPLFQGPIPGPFIARYNTTLTITGLSGEIWDIDSNEQWYVEVLNSSGVPIADQFSPKFAAGDYGPNTLESLPWLFQFNNLPAGVRSVRVTYLGTNSNSVGFAFDNFSPTFAEEITGDYNHNGIVDAADYVVWRKTFGSTLELDADGNNSGTIDNGDYTVWKTHFANPLVSGVATTQIPEVRSIGSILLAFTSFMLWTRRLKGSYPT